MLRLLPLLFLLAGCATSGAPLMGGPGGSSIRVATGRDAVIGSVEDAFLAPITVDTTLERVWPLIPPLYAALQIPVTVVDRANAVVGNPRIEARGDFLGQPISTFIRCGGTAAISEVADRHQVLLSVSTILTAAPEGGTRIQTRVVGSAKDPFTSTPPRPCSTTGRLETEIAALLRQQLGYARPAEQIPSIALLTPAPQPPEAVEKSLAGPASPVLLALGGLAGGAIGVFAGSQLGRDCETRCLNARGLAGPLVGVALSVPLGVHLSNQARGDLPKSLLAAGGWAVLGAVVAGVTAETWGVWAVAPAQLISAVLIERATSGVD